MRIIALACFVAVAQQLNAGYVRVHNDSGSTKMFGVYHPSNQTRSQERAIGADGEYDFYDWLDAGTKAYEATYQNNFSATGFGPHYYVGNGTWTDTTTQCMYETIMQVDPGTCVYRVYTNGVLAKSWTQNGVGAFQIGYTNDTPYDVRLDQIIYGPDGTESPQTLYSWSSNNWEYVGSYGTATNQVEYGSPLTDFTITRTNTGITYSSTTNQAGILMDGFNANRDETWRAAQAQAQRDGAANALLSSIAANTDGLETTANAQLAATGSNTIALLSLTGLTNLSSLTNIATRVEGLTNEAYTEANSARASVSNTISGAAPAGYYYGPSSNAPSSINLSNPWETDPTPIVNWWQTLLTDWMPLIVWIRLAIAVYVAYKLWDWLLTSIKDGIMGALMTPSAGSTEVIPVFAEATAISYGILIVASAVTIPTALVAIWSNWPSSITSGLSNVQYLIAPEGAPTWMQAGMTIFATIVPIETVLTAFWSWLAARIAFNSLCMFAMSIIKVTPAG